MSTAPKIPKGWRRLRKGTKINPYVDKYVSPFGEVNYTSGFYDKVPQNQCIYIRRIAEKKK